MSNTAKLSLRKQTIDKAEPRAKQVLGAAQQQGGFIPNMYANMVNSPGLLETYLFGARVFRSESGFTPAEQEVVFLSISFENDCTYCMAAHSMIAEKVSQVPTAVVGALRTGGPIPDAKLGALAGFVRLMVASRGQPTQAQLEEFLAAGYTERHALEIVLAIGVKTLSNYTNHLFHTEVDDRFSAYRWNGLSKAA